MLRHHKACDGNVKISCFEQVVMWVHHCAIQVQPNMLDGEKLKHCKETKALANVTGTDMTSCTLLICINRPSNLPDCLHCMER